MVLLAGRGKLSASRLRSAKYWNCAPVGGPELVGAGKREDVELPQEPATTWLFLVSLLIFRMYNRAQFHTQHARLLHAPGSPNYALRRVTSACHPGRTMVIVVSNSLWFVTSRRMERQAQPVCARVQSCKRHDQLYVSALKWPVVVWIAFVGVQLWIPFPPGLWL